MATSIASAALTAVIRDTSAALLDPSTLTLEVADPSGRSSSYTYGAAQITKSSTGVYTKTVYCDIPGMWKATWTATTSLLRKVAHSTFEVTE